MEVAAEVFADHGFSGVGMRELCARCGIGAPTLYHYFGSKERLFEAVCVEKYKAAMVVASRTVDADHSVAGQLDLLCATVFDLLVKDRVLFLLLRRDLIDGSISGRALRSRHQYDGILHLLHKVIAQHDESGDAKRKAFTAAAMIFGYCEFVHVGMNGEEPVTEQALADHRAHLKAAVRKLVLDEQVARQ
ncbi:MAG: helix-turn-helix domain-containing protein [Pseudomonadota bacterium]|nr:helix-turn-helix domain-containing protein [Pseudomonadota bacterium]